MILKKLILHNCGPHAHLELDFAPGIMGLQGLNGSGKSSVIEGLYMAYTGELLTCEVKEELLRRGEKTGYAAMECTAADGDFKVTRLLHKIGHMLTRQGKDPLVKKDDVNRFIQDRIGLDPKLLGDTAFIAQGMLWNILTGDRLARARAVSAMFGLDKAAQIYAASTVVNARIISYPDRAKEIGELTEQHDRAEGEDKILENELHSLRDAVKGSEETVRMLEEAMKLPDTESKDLQVKELSGQLKAAYNEVTAARMLLDGLPDHVMELQSSNALENQAARLARELKVIEAGRCPTCEQPSPFKMDVESARLEHARAVAGRDAAVGDYNRHSKERARLQGSMVQLEVNKRSLQEKLDALEKTAAIPAKDKAEYRKALDQFNGIGRRIGELETRRAHTGAVLASSKDMLARYTQEQVKYEACRGGLDLVAGIKQLFHPEGLPKDALQKRLERYNGLIAKWLAMFKAPFAIRLTEDMVFVCDTGGYRDIGVKTGLSGGQKVLGAVAVMLARAEMLSFGCGILVLDEPTAYLDRVNLPILVQVLKDADVHLRAEKLVLLVPTHEAALEPVMSRVVRL